MTPEERADKLSLYYGWSYRERDAVQHEIRAAVEEGEARAYREGHDYGVKDGQAEAFAEGKRFAYEDAAKIAEKFEHGVMWNSTDIAMMIRARAKEMK
jgi:flagellar biosynthesis/type III secretory pathway protein FliH